MHVCQAAVTVTGEFVLDKVDYGNQGSGAEHDDEPPLVSSRQEEIQYNILRGDHEACPVRTSLDA